MDNSQLTSSFSLSIKGSEGAWPLPLDTMESTNSSPPDCALTSEVGSINCGSSLMSSAIMISESWPGADKRVRFVNRSAPTTHPYWVSSGGQTISGPRCNFAGPRVLGIVVIS